MQRLIELEGRVGLPQWAVECLTRLFSALSDPTRVRIIHALADARRLNVTELASATGLTVSATSHQLRLLRDRHLVRAERDGRSVYYLVADEHVRTLFCTGIEHALDDCSRGGRRSNSQPR
jgi:ArsR family transcriptional regulator